MNNHNEAFSYLWLGDIKLDVSNVSQGRLDISSEVWNKTISTEYELTKKEMKKFKLIKDPTERGLAVVAEQTKKKNKITKRMIEKQGLYLMRQDFMVLKRRYSFGRAVIEYIKRYFIGMRLFKTLNKTQYEAFEDWISFLLTGKKKRDLERQKGILEIIDEMVLKLESKTNLDQEKCLELLRTSVGVIAEELTTSIPDHKV